MYIPEEYTLKGIYICTSYMPIHSNFQENVDMGSCVMFSVGILGLGYVNLIVLELWTLEWHHANSKETKFGFSSIFLFTLKYVATIGVIWV